MKHQYSITEYSPELREAAKCARKKPRKDAQSDDRKIR